MGQFIEITPDLEAKIKKNEYFLAVPAGIELSRDNLSYKDILSHIVSYDQEKNLFYFFAPPQDDGYFRLKYIRGLPNIKFGFGTGQYSIASRQIRLNPCGELPAELDALHPVLQKRFVDLKSRQEVDLIWLLEELSDITKSAFEYDFGEAEDTANQSFEHLKAGYTRSQFATKKGVCEDQGDLFRIFLNNLGLENILYFQQGCEKKEILHDTTIILDKERKTWLVVNSLSPSKQYNVAPLKKLEELGMPYVPLEMDLSVYDEDVFDIDIEKLMKEKADN